MLRIGITGISYFLNLFPTRFVYFIGDCAGWIWFYVVPFRKSVITDNLRKAYGDELTEKQIRQITKGNLKHYGRLILETLLSASWTIDDFRKKVHLSGIEHAEKARQAGRGAFFLTCHLGPFEFLASVGLAHGLPVDIVVKHARNRQAEDLLQWYRGRLGVGVLLESGTAKDILKSLSHNRFVGFIFDQFMGPPIGLPVKFFNQEAGTPVALALLTEKRDVPILPVYSYRDENSKLHVVIEPAVEYPPLSDDKDTRFFEKTQHLNNVLERIIRRYPEQWFWLHRRWKPYLGEPRWKMKHAISLSMFAVLVMSAISLKTFADTPTGIPIPPAPPVFAPHYKASADGDVEEDGEAAKKMSPVENSQSPEEKTSKAAENKKKRRGKKKGAKEMSESNEPLKNVPPVPTPVMFDTVPAEKVPFEIGERLEIQLSWIGLNAAIAAMEVRPGPVIDGRPTYEFWGNVLSSKLVDAIYHVDNTVESYVDRKGLIPYQFNLHMFETQQKKETQVIFNHPTSKAKYWSSRLSKRWGDEKIDRVDEIVPGAQDLWSAIYYFRTLNFELNQKQSFTVYENGKNYVVELLPIASELVQTRVGAFPCWKILVTVKLNNIFRPTGDVFMWVSADSKHYIIKFDAKIKIGSLVGNIVSLKEHL